MNHVEQQIVTKTATWPSPCFGIDRQTSLGLDVISLELPAHREFHLTVRPLPGEKPEGMIHRLAAVLREKDAVVVRHGICARNSVHAEMLSALRCEFRVLDWPVMWIGGRVPAADGMGGMHVLAVTGTRAQTVSMNGEILGRTWGNEHVRHCFVGNLRPTGLTQSRTAQCQEVLEKMEQVLLEARMSMANLARTWFLLDDIWTWYGPFNAVRTKFYSQKWVSMEMLPASTGIGGRRPGGVALTASAWAVQGLDQSFKICAAPSPLQCPSIEYGSAFGRAVLITEPACRRLFVSGTASIAPNGRSAHTGDVQGQIALAMKVIQVILVSQGFGLQDITRATAYFKDVHDLPVFDRWRTEHNAKSLPIITTQADLCREELLFEIELDAVSVGNAEGIATANRPCNGIEH